ncbi:IS30 family transposase [Tessaracoccus palaemonis]|uniref:IS30 family transposase n=1 Tax=Tessaracoccus palaemonis TaxID=2829499 RepID=A0ABX8SN84_9ACTN|nr:IS30 family transposase [Tessaracoccus palaemonis]QXT64419.1 IS30 family transposase [Tessaracoccus palaemonis]QXT64424.1 IS30 family transposase [Tessaracoccus palaemonis]
MTAHDRAEISTGLKAGWGIRRIAVHIDRAPSVISREIRRNSTKTCGYRVVRADVEAQRRRRRPQTRKIDADPVLRARVLGDLKRSRTPRQIAGRLRLEACDPTVETMVHSTPADGAQVSHEAIYRFIYALPKGELARHSVMLRSKRTSREPRSKDGRRAPIVAMVSIDDRPADVTERRIPGAWEGDLIIGAHGKSAAATLVERVTRFTIICGLPEGKKAVAVADTLAERMWPFPEVLRTSLTWDQGSEMAEHARLTAAVNLPVYFAHSRSPWERGTNENTNGLIREYLPKGTYITSNQAYLDAIADELNDRPRASLGFYTPREKFEALLAADVASTS